jgi:hypothetical protein
VEQLYKKYGASPVLIMTSARKNIAAECGKPVLSYQEARKNFQEQTTVPYLIVLGTGYGVENQCIREYSDLVLEPIRGVSGYNHLSVRSAAAIILDRVFGRV